MCTILNELLLYIIYENDCTSHYCQCCPYQGNEYDIENDLTEDFIQHDIPFLQNYIYQ